MMNIPDALLEEARAGAASENRTVTSLTEQALRELLARAKEPSQQVRLPTNGNPHARFLLDIDDKELVQSVLDSDDYR